MIETLNKNEMDAKNLRIGNWVMYSSKIQVNENKIRECVKYPDRFSPIRLTEKWIEDFGFEKLTDKNKGFKSTSYTYMGGYAFIVYFDGERLSVNFWQGNEKKYVHELQNLFFALTGTELELKDECSTCG